MTSETVEKTRHFIQQIVEEDIHAGKHGGKVVTRFPPEPNGYLHIGHAKSICLNFGIAKTYQGVCHLRLDDTNPMKEELEFAEAIKEDVRWLGFDWGGKLYHASDYYEKLYACAVHLIKKGKAYVDQSSLEDIRRYRGTLTEPGKPSPDRDRPIEESLDLFQRMRQGEFSDGAYVLRAKIDMASGNLNMRDPVIYRIRHAHHQMTGDAWCIYPLYDFAHSLSDAFEGITHSLCTLEFQDHRPLYDWCVQETEVACQPQQIEFARLNISHNITSKRKLKWLVEQGSVTGWDDPRMPTLCGMRRRGYPPEAIVHFCERIGVTKSDSVIDMGVLEGCVREELNVKAPRAMCVLNPLKVVITNYLEGDTQTLTASRHPNNPEMGSRDIPFSREIFIEREDFLEDPPKKFFRLAPGKEVRLRGSYVIRCEQVVKNPESGDITELHCSYDPDTLGKKPEGRKVKGVIHWVSIADALECEVRLYDRLFLTEQPGVGEELIEHINPESLSVLNTCYAEPSVASAQPGQCFQFERVGYFCVDSQDSEPSRVVFNRVVGLRDSWVKISGE